jgi:anti-anti-sigma factor
MSPKTNTRLRVLIVEDSEDDEAAVLYALERAGYSVVHERVDTAAGLNHALDQAEWDIVISDHDMPQFNSLAAVRLVRARAVDLAFILVSGNVGEAAVAATMRAGANDFVSKNDLTRLATAIERALRDAAEDQERKKAEAALRESEERFALAVRGSCDGIWDWNIASGAVYLSDRIFEMLGYEPHAVERYEDLAALMDSSDRERLESAVSAQLERRTPLNIELDITTKQGEIRTFCVRGEALWDEATSRATRMAGSFSDVTARKRTEAKLREQIETIQRQHEAIRELSAPIIEVWDGVLTVPVLGTLDRDRATALMDALLAAVARTHCQRAIIDLTGVATMDEVIAGHLIHLVRALQLLGAQGIVVGIQPQVARAIVSLGVELTSITTLANLREALLYVMRGPQS